MDNAQFPKTGGTWTNRVQMIVNGKSNWVTIPIVRNYHGVRLTKDMKINNSTLWREKCLKTLQMNYARAPFFAQVYTFLEPLVKNPTDSLSEYNIVAIRALAKSVGLGASRIVIGSALSAGGTATDLLIAMTKAVRGTAYLYGGGAAGYQEDEKFSIAGIELIQQNFKHPVYSQRNTIEFIPGLSIVDTLMNLGFDGTGALITTQERG